MRFSNYPEGAARHQYSDAIACPDDIQHYMESTAGNQWRESYLTEATRNLSDSEPSGGVTQGITLHLIGFQSLVPVGGQDEKWGL